MQQLSSEPGQTGWLKRTVYSLYLVSMLALAAWLMLGSSSTAFANQVDVKMTARSLYDGHFKFGDWLPIEVNLINNGDAVDVLVQASIVTRNTGSNYTTSYQREVSLSERVNKRLLLYILPFVESANSSGSVSYDTSVNLLVGTRKLAEEKVKLVPVIPTNYLVGSIVQDFGAMGNLGLGNFKVTGQRRVHSVRLALSDIPDRASGMRSLDALVISETNTETLTADQRNTLREWVESGGQLILMGGNGWSRVRAAFSPAMLPLDVSNYTNIASLDGMFSPNGEEIKGVGTLARPAVVARGQVVKDAQLLSHLMEGNEVLPIAAERRLGEGRIVAVSLDLATAPVSEWAGTAQIWQDLFAFNVTPVNNIYNENNPQVRNSSDLLPYISNVPELRLPDALPFFAIILAYILLAAPITYIVLRKLGRLEWAWVTLPILGGLFTVAALSYANSQPPGQVLISQMSVVQVGPDQEIAQVRSYAAVFSPEDRTYDIGPSPLHGDGPTARTLITPLNRPTASAGEVDPVRTVVEGDSPRLDNFQIGQWNAQAFSLDTNIPARNYQIVTDLHYTNDKIVGTVRNNTGSPIRQSVLMLGDQVLKLRDVIEVGEIVPVDFSLPLPTAAVTAYCQPTYSSNTSTSTTPAERLAAVLQQERRDDKVTKSRAEFLRKIYEIGRYSPLNNQYGLDLVGWMDQNPLPLSVSGFTSQSKSSQVLIARLPVEVGNNNGDGRLLLPAMGFRSESVNTNNLIPVFTNRSDRTDQVCVTKGSLTIQFRLPMEEGGFKVKNLNLYLNSIVQNGGPRGPNLPDTIQLYDYQAKKWQTLPNVVNSALPINTGSYFATPPAPIKNSIENPGRYADPLTGRILLRLSSDANTTIFVQYGLEVEGTRN